MIYDSGGLTGRKLWPVLEEVFKEPSIDPNQVGPAAEMSIVNLKMLRTEIHSTRQTVWILAATAALLVLLLVVSAARRRTDNQYNVHYPL